MHGSMGRRLPLSPGCTRECEAAAARIMNRGVTQEWQLERRRPRRRPAGRRPVARRPRARSARRLARSSRIPRPSCRKVLGPRPALAGRGFFCCEPAAAAIRDPRGSCGASARYLRLRPSQEIPNGTHHRRRLHPARSESLPPGADGRDPRQADQARLARLIPAGENKEVVTALREIAAGLHPARLSGARADETEQPGGSAPGSAASSGLDRDAEGERGSRADLARHATSLPSSSFRQVAHQREAEARAAVLGRGQLVDLIELVEDELLVVGTDPDAGVAHLAERASAIDDARGDVDASLARELRRVVEQQEQDLVDLREVGPDLREAAPRSASRSRPGLFPIVSCTLKIASSTTSRKFTSWISTGISPCLMRQRSRMFWSVRRKAVPSSSARAQASAARSRRARRSRPPAPR